MAADGPREGDRDGRGNLTQRGLIAFARFFLERAVDQVDFMGGLMEPEALDRRIEAHIEEEVRAKRLPRGSFAVLREAVFAGEVERSRVPSLTGYEERAARKVTSALDEQGHAGRGEQPRAAQAGASPSMPSSAGFLDSTRPSAGGRP